MALFHLFTFPLMFLVVLLGGRNLEDTKENRGRRWALHVSLIPAGISFLLFAVYYHLDITDYSWNAVILTAGSLLVLFQYLLLEHSVYIRRIRESYFYQQYRNRLVLCLRASLLLAGLILLIVLNQILLTREILTRDHTKSLLALYAAVYFVLHVYIFAELYAFKQGTIKRNYYLFALSPSLFLVMVLPQIFSNGLERAMLFPIFSILNLLALARLYSAYFERNVAGIKRELLARKQYEAKQNEIVRQVINAPEHEDLKLLQTMVEESLEKGRSQLIEPEYGITGATLYTVKKGLLRLEDRRLIFGHNAPLSRNLSLRNMTRSQINETIFRQSVQISHCQVSDLRDLNDLGERIVKTCLTDKEPYLFDPLPDHLKGIHKMMGIYPIFDRDELLALLVIFKDDFSKIYPAEERELKTLAENLSIVYMIRRGKAVMAEQQRLRGEMEIAQKLQTSLVPRHIPMKDYDAAAFMETASEVGGDIYDYKQTTQGNFLAIGDVSGHGLPAGIMAALQMAAFHGTLEGIRMGESSFSLDKIYDGVNRVLCTLNRDRMGSDRFMTLNYLMEEKGWFVHAGAHEIGLIYRIKDDVVEEKKEMVSGTGFMGISEYLASSQSVNKFFLHPGDILLLYSDGIIEAKNTKNEQFGLERLKKVLRENHTAPSAQIIDSIHEELLHFCLPGNQGNQAQEFEDDITLVALKRK